MATLPASGNNSATFKIDIDENVPQLQAIRTGRSLDTPPVYMAVLTANDSGLAPAGQDVVYLASNVPAQPRDGWTKTKSAMSDAIMRSVSLHLDGIDSEIGRIETSPADFGDQFATPNGSYFHVDMTPLRLAMNRPAPGLGGYQSPVANYYHAGAGSHPGGGVSGWPGRLAAETALGKHNG